MSVRLYVFSIIGVHQAARQNYVEPHLLLDVSPQSAAQHGLEDMRAKYPQCDSYQVGVVHEVPETMINDIKRLL